MNAKTGDLYQRGDRYYIVCPGAIAEALGFSGLGQPPADATEMLCVRPPLRPENGDGEVYHTYWHVPLPSLVEDFSIVPSKVNLWQYRVKRMAKMSARTANTEEMSGAGTKHKTATEAVMHADAAEARKTMSASMFQRLLQEHMKDPTMEKSQALDEQIKNAEVALSRWASDVLSPVKPAEEKAKYFWKIDMDKLAKPHPRPKLKAHVEAQRQKRRKASADKTFADNLAKLETHHAKSLGDIVAYQQLTCTTKKPRPKPKSLCLACQYVRGCANYGAPTPNCQYRAQGIDINEEDKGCADTCMDNCCMADGERKNVE